MSQMTVEVEAYLAKHEVQSVIGDAVNAASRLTELAKDVEGGVLADLDVYFEVLWTGAAAGYSLTEGEARPGARG